METQLTKRHPLRSHNFISRNWRLAYINVISIICWDRAVKKTREQEKEAIRKWFDKHPALIKHRKEHPEMYGKKS